VTDIKGFFQPFAPHPYVSVAVKVDLLGIDWTVVDVLIDTGADVTAIHAADALTRLGLSKAHLSPDGWPPLERDSYLGIGGDIQYRRVPAAYRFRRADGSSQEIRGDLRLGEYREDFEDLPSLLGLDLLKHFCLTLDGPAGVVTLGASRSS